MRKHHPVSQAPLATGMIDPPKQEIDYAPREYTTVETLRSGWKYWAVAAIILLLFWIVENYLY